MLKLRTKLGLGIAFAGFGFAATAQDASTVVATVGDTEITLGEMILTRSQLPPEYQQFPPEVLFGGILDQLIQQQLLADTLTDVPARVDMALTNERRTLIAGEAVNELTQEFVTEEAIQEAYDARYGGVTPGTEYNASHLLVETEIEAATAKTRVENGEEFADVARDVSTGPTGPNGGNLGWFGPGQMVAEFQAAVEALEIGGVSDPVQTQFGWHIVKLNETRLQEQPELEQLRGQLSQQVQEEAVRMRLSELRERATIVMPEPDAFDPNLLLDLSLLDD